MSTLDEKLKNELSEVYQNDTYPEDAIESIKQAFIDEGWVQTKWEPTGPSLDLNKRAAGVEE